VNVGIRPEHLTITEGSDYAIEATVKISEALGEVTQVYFEPNANGDAMIAKLLGIHRDVRNTKLRMTAAPEHVHLFANGHSLLYAK